VFWWANLKERNHWGDKVVDGKKIIRRIFRKRFVGVCTGLSWLRIETCKCGNKPSGSIKCGEFLD
jgi:hypothetical protein